MLGRTPVDIDDAAAQLRQAISASSDFAPSVIALVADTDCCHALPALGAALAGETPAVTVCNVDDIFGMDFALPPVKDGLAAGTVREKAVPAAAEPDTCENADCATAEAKAVREKADCGSAASCACTPATTVVAEPVEKYVCSNNKNARSFTVVFHCFFFFFVNCFHYSPTAFLVCLVACVASHGLLMVFTFGEEAAAIYNEAGRGDEFGSGFSVLPPFEGC